MHGFLFLWATLLVATTAQVDPPPAAEPVTDTQPATDPQPAAAPSRSADAEVARVGSRVITEGDVRRILLASGLPETLWPDRRDGAIDMLIYDALREIYTAERGVKVDEAAFAKEFQQTRRSLESRGPAALQELESRGVTLEQLRAAERARYAFRQALASEVRDEDVDAAMQAYGGFLDGRQLHLRQIFIPARPFDDADRNARARETIENLATAIRSGRADFEAAAEEHNPGKSAARGGSIGYVEFVALPLPLAQAAFTAKPGELLGPIQTRFGYHLLLIDRAIPNPRAATTQPEARNVMRSVLQIDAEPRILIDVARRHKVDRPRATGL